MFHTHTHPALAGSFLLPEERIHASRHPRMLVQSHSGQKGSRMPKREVPERELATGPQAVGIPRVIAEARADQRATGVAERPMPEP